MLRGKNNPHRMVWKYPPANQKVGFATKMLKEKVSKNIIPHGGLMI